LSQPRRCPYCHRSFLPSAYRPQQSVCSRPECQRQRRTDYHRKKLATDTEYHQVALESQKQWREEHPDYQKQWRQRNPQRVENNRERQRQRDQKRRLRRRLLDKNNLALDLKHSVSEVWLLGPKLCNLDKNNLASAQVLIFPSLTHSSEDRGPS
jgi:cell division protein FtsI/penicillin-binding protein 2